MSHECSHQKHNTGVSVIPEANGCRSKTTGLKGEKLRPLPKQAVYCLWRCHARGLISELSVESSLTWVSKLCSLLLGSPACLASLCLCPSCSRGGGEVFQVSSRSKRINLHLVTVMNCSAPGSPLTPAGFLPLQQDSPGAQPGPPVPVHVHFNGTSRPRASCAHRADKHSHQRGKPGPAPSEQLVRELLLQHRNEGPAGGRAEP